MKKLLLVLICSGLFVLPAFAASNTQEYKLANGMKLIVREDHRSPVVISEVWYKVGSSYEHGGITGVSHVLEHMMFRGSKNYSADEFLQTIAENGGEQNAFTTYDYTAYYQMLGADKLTISFKLESDRMRDLLLRQEDFIKEIQVVMEERRMRTEDDPQQLTFERFMAALHVSNPYHHPIIGWMDDLKNLNINDVQQWYQTWYAPNNAVLVVVGDVKPGVVYQLAQEYFGRLKSRKVPALKPQREVTPLGTRTVVVKTPAKLPWLVMGYNVPVLNTIKQRSEPYALLVLAGILAGGDSARLEQNLVRGKQIASDIDIGYDPYDRIDGQFIIEATPAQGHSIDELRDALTEEIQQLQTTPVTADELARVKAQVIANRVYQKDSIEQQAYEIGSLESVGLSWREADLAISEIEKITPAQIAAVAKKYLRPERLTIAILDPLPMSKEAAKPWPEPVTGEQHVR